MANTKALREERAKLIAEAGKLLEVADKDTRDLTGEESAKWALIHDEADKLKTKIDRYERQENEERGLNDPQARIVKPKPGADVSSSVTAEERNIALAAWMKGPGRVTDQERAIAVRAGIPFERNDLTVNFLFRQAPKWNPLTRQPEYRALSVGVNSAGGFTVEDEQMRDIERALLTFGGMRQVSRVIRTGTGATLPWPTVNDTSQQGAILAENAQVVLQDVVFGQVSLGAFKYSSKAVLVSVELLNDSTVDVASFIGSILGERLGRITNQHYTTGTGTAEPRGVVTDAVLGKAGLTGQTVTVIFEDLIDLIHSVDPAYRSQSRFMFHDTTLRFLKKLKDTQNRPLFLPGLAEREPDTINDYPYTINQSVAVMAASAKSILFGDFGKYVIRDVADVTLLRLNERYADFHQVGFFAFLRSDGRLIDAGTNPVKFYQNSAT